MSQDQFLVWVGCVVDLLLKLIVFIISHKLIWGPYFSVFLFIICKKDEFYAHSFLRCGPCKQMAPKVAELSTKYLAAVFIKLDVDRCRVGCNEIAVASFPDQLCLVYKWNGTG